MKIKFIFILVILLLPVKSFSQIIISNIIDRINSSSYIFEGEVIRSTGYWNQSKDFIYTSLTIDIKKIFKGNLICGKVELITEGGQVGDSIALQISHNLTLSKGQKGIFMCRQTQKELPLVDYYPENNYQKLETTLNEQGFIRYFEDGINPEVWDYQFSLDSLAQVYDLMQIYTQINYVDCFPGVSIFATSQSSLDDAEYIADTLNYNSPLINPISLTNTIDTTITSSISNSFISSSNGQRYLEFDLKLRDTLNGVYFNEGVFMFKFDTLTFGSNVISPNHTVIVTRGRILEDSATYNWPRLQNYLSDGFAIDVSSKQNVPVTLFDIPDTFTTLAHIKMKIKDCNNIDTISQFQVSPHIFYTLDQHDNSHQYYYDNVLFANNLPFNGCGYGAITINSILPNTVRAGTNDTVTIKGHGFGNARGIGNVFLSNADDGGGTYLPLDSIDYISNGWNDSTIVFVVPSVIDSTSLSNGDGHPGTGRIKVKTDNGDSVSTALDSLIIKFGVSNWIVKGSVTFKKFLVNLTPQDTSSIPNAIVFYPDSTVSFYNNGVSTLSKAISDWTCLTTVNWHLGNEWNNNDTTAKWDGVSRIMFRNFEPANYNTIGITYQWTRGDLYSCQNAWSKESDILFNNRYFYVADTATNNDIQNGVDMYQVMLHELGHAHSITHVNDPSKVMWWQSTSSGVNAANRRVKLFSDSPAIEAGNYVVQQSQLFNVLNCNDGQNVMTPGTAHCSVIWVPEIENPISELSIYPNPTNSNLNIKFSSDRSDEVIISILDIVGNEVYFSKENTITNEYSKTIYLESQLNSGIYFIKLKLGQSYYVGKFIKQ